MVLDLFPVAAKVAGDGRRSIQLMIDQVVSLSRGRASYRTTSMGDESDNKDII